MAGNTILTLYTVNKGIVNYIEALVHCMQGQEIFIEGVYK
jgi:hypothetical protein